MHVHTPRDARQSSGCTRSPPPACAGPGGAPVSPDAARQAGPSGSAAGRSARPLADRAVAAPRGAAGGVAATHSRAARLPYRARAARAAAGAACHLRVARLARVAAAAGAARRAVANAHAHGADASAGRGARSAAAARALPRSGRKHPSPVAPQLWHAPPSLLHAPAVGGDVQTEPVQQPPGQEAALQTHWWFEQTCPAPHAAPAPQLHTPVAEQLSALVASQDTHMLPRRYRSS